MAEDWASWENIAVNYSYGDNPDNIATGEILYILAL